jgi:3D (Asp-Asp-Asp) domain-containing protein
MRRYIRRRMILLLTCIILSFWLGTIYVQSRVPEPKHIYVPVLIEKEGEEEEVDTEWRTFTATAYCSCEKCCGHNHGITKSGEEAVEGLTVAADWNVLPKGSLVEIENIGYRVVQDTGNAIKGNRIDVYFDKHEDAVKFGKKEVKLRIVRQI